MRPENVGTISLKGKHTGYIYIYIYIYIYTHFLQV